MYKADPILTFPLKRKGKLTVFLRTQIALFKLATKVAKDLSFHFKGRTKDGSVERKVKGSY